MKKSFNIYLKGLLCLTVVLFLWACKKHKDIPPSYTKAKFTVSLKSGGSNIIWDSIHCLNAAANKYSVASANFYISNIILKSPDGTVFTSKKIFFIDPKTAAKTTFSLDTIPPAEYSEISFLIGLESGRNTTFGLPTTTDNLNMAWPDAMGGGYHFMKLEGHYRDTLNVIKGYAIHLGKNENLVSVKINQNLHQKYWDHDYSLYFDINEVFANPYKYDLNFETNYTMSDSVAMNRIKNNMSDAFSLHQNN